MLSTTPTAILTGLRFCVAGCGYTLREGHHIILKGASGSGKDVSCHALGNAACRKYKSVRYIRLPELLDELSMAQASGEFKKAIKTYPESWTPYSQASG